MNKSDPVKRPDHYTHIAGVECRQVAGEFSYHIGSAIKYLWRHRHKGDEIQDLRKAIQHISYEIERLGRFKGEQDYPRIIER